MGARKRKDLTGFVSGRLTALEPAPDLGDLPKQRTRWWCRCACGQRLMVLTQNLLNGNSESCGCWNREKAAERTSVRNRTHGLSDVPEYRVWHDMKRRCYDKRIAGYAKYGARGIVVCDRWRESFEAFYADMGPRPSPTHSIDRINNDGPYAPENCRWATMQEQMRNLRKTLREHGVAGAAEIAAIEGVKPATIYHRRWIAKHRREQR